MNDWIEEWQSDTELHPDMVDWMKTRPDCIKEVMVRFPPGCLVMANRPLLCPIPGSIGVVFSYFEDGGLTILQHPESDLRAQCQPDWLEVVGYRGDLTPEKVKAICG